MPTPKSVIKVDKNGVQYTSNVDAAQYYIFELSRAALRDVGKFVRKTFATHFYEVFEKRTGFAVTAKAVNYKVFSSKNTKFPRVQIGIKPSVMAYSAFQELGSSKTKRYGLLTKSAEDNVAEIVRIESQYLSGLSGEASRLESLIDEQEIDGDSE